jgi:cation transport ATPase
MMQAIRAPESEANGHSCPACGKAVDSLRAGHVAVLEDRFLYFCDEHCKRDLVAQSSGTLPSSVATAEPPPVASSPISRERAVAANGAAERRTDVALTAALSRQAGEGGLSLQVDATLSPMRGEGRGEGTCIRAQADEPPTTLPSVLVASKAPVASSPPAVAVPVDVLPPLASEPALARGDSEASEDSRDDPGDGDTGLPTLPRVAPALVLSGVALGVLGAVAPLVVRGADVLRLPLALVAVTVVAVRWALEPREPEAASPALAAAPAIGGLVAAVWAVVVRDPQAPVLATFAGLAASAVLGVDYLVARASVSTRLARDAIARGLEGDVRVVRGGESRMVSPFDVKPGEQVVALAGESLGVDGIVAAGEAEVVPWLGASSVVKKHEGDSLVAGAVVSSGQLRATTTWAGADRAFYRLALSPALRADVAAPIVRALRRSLERGVPVLAVLAAIAAYAGGARGPEVLGAACAVALAIAARGAASLVALHHAQGQLAALGAGVVYKDAAAFDDAGRANVAVLCSRGTVLMGEPEIVELESLGPASRDRVLALAAGAEAASTHPFASAILRAARAKDERVENVRSATVHPGLGVTALAASGERLVVGSRALLLRERVSVAVADGRATELESQGRSVLLVALAGKLIGLLAMQDGMRPGARAAVQRLLDAKLEPVLLSGEARETCETIGRALDVEHIRPEVLPSDRGTEVRSLGEGGQVVAVIGHPQTDDAALGAADVSVALGAAGRAPGEWSVCLASDDVRDAARALSLAREARDRAKVAMAVGILPGVLAALAVGWGVLPIWTAPIALFGGVLAALSRARR